MSIFQQYLDQLFIQLVISDTDLDSGYQIFRLFDEPQARIFRQPRHTSYRDAAKIAPPTTGKFVAATLLPATNKLILHFMEFPLDGGESKSFAGIEYFKEEIYKAPVQIAGWLLLGKVPKADSEYEKLETVK